MTTTTLENFSKQIENFLLLLTQKERFVVERRFNLDQKERATLEEIGQQFSVTRERIRQIEKNALNKLKRNLENCPLLDVANLAFDFISHAGGVIKEDILISKILAVNSNYSVEALQLIFTIDKRFVRSTNTVAFYPYLMLTVYSQSDVEGVCKMVIDSLGKSKSVQSIADIYGNLSAKAGFEMSQELFASILHIDKKIKVLTDNMVGLVEWRHINPRTLRDKIFYVLRRKKEAMHFVEIANQIIEAKFDKKKINLQAVHNELIRHNDFVLIGRGIYGLSEWGYKSGTVADVIQSVLKGKESMSQDEIVEAVLKQRKVKPITIVLSLKNKDMFVRVGRKQYALSPA